MAKTKKNIPIRFLIKFSNISENITYRLLKKKEKYIKKIRDYELNVLQMQEH